jgi:hypothetical protein
MSFRSASPTTAPDRPSGRWNRDWICACVIGELIGFVPPAVTGAVLVTLDAPEIVLVSGLVVAGGFEGLILGRAQHAVLRRLVPGVTGWAAATAVAAGLAWLAGMGGSSLLGAVGATALIVAVPGWVIGLLAMGILQYRRLRQVVPDASAWIPATTIAWLIGVAIPVVALSVVPNQWPPAVHVLVAIPSAVAMGATVGAITGRTLNGLVDELDAPGAP